MRFIKSYFIYALFICKLILILSYIGYTNKNMVLVQRTSELTYEECNAIHIGVVCIGYNNNVHFYTLLKSIYYVRTSSLHFHIIVDNQSEKTAKMLFATWAMPQVRVSYYNINGTTFHWLSQEHNLGVLKFTFPKLIPVELSNKIIVIDLNVIFAANLNKLWNLFDNFNDQQFIGLPRTNLKTRSGNNLDTNLILYNLGRLQVAERNNLWTRIVDEYGAYPAGTKASNLDILNQFINKTLADALYVMPCEWSIQEGVILSNNNGSDCYNNNNLTKTIESSNFMNKQTLMEYDGNVLRKQVYGCFDNENSTRELRPIPKTCKVFPTFQISKWRTLLYFRKFQYVPTEYDVTLVSQLTFTKLRVLEDVARRWEGPMSLSIYMSDIELHECIHYVNNSKILQNRTNIAYHAIFKEGQHYPINILRNIALNQVITPYVFLNDIDLVPMQDLYLNIKKYISEIKYMNNKALIVPSFATAMSKTKIPKSKSRLLQMLNKKNIFIMLDRWRGRSHGPTNFTKWRSAKEPYQIKWAPKYEPYVVVEKNVTQYDERFFGYGWNKISHIMELEAQNYEFLVLPNAFVVHRYHSKGAAKKQYLNSKALIKCILSLKYEWNLEIRKKYGRHFII